MGVLSNGGMGRARIERGNDKKAPGDFRRLDVPGVI
jgi:hypothetical protein